MKRSQQPEIPKDSLPLYDLIRNAMLEYIGDDSEAEQIRKMSAEEFARYWVAMKKEPPHVA